MLLQLCVSALLLGGTQEGATAAPPPAAAKGDATAMLKERLGKLKELKSYAFEAMDDGAGMGGRGRGRGGGGEGGGAPPAPTPTTGKVEIGKGVELHRGETLAYKKGDKLVYKKGDGWELYEAPEFGGGAAGGSAGGGERPRRGEGGGGEGGGGGERPRRGEGAGGGAGGPPGGGGDMRERFAMMGLANQILPHEMLEKITKGLRDVQCNPSDGSFTFTGKLDDAAADDVSGAKRVREMFAGGGRGGGGGGGTAGGEFSITAAGTATIVFDGNGHPTKLVVETTTTTQRGETKRTQSFAFKACGATKVELPADAAAKLGA